MRARYGRKVGASLAALALALAVPAISHADKGGVPHNGSHGRGLGPNQRPCPHKGKGKGPKQSPKNSHGKKCGFHRV